jgi:hypothetical protein
MEAPHVVTCQSCQNVAALTMAHGDKREKFSAQGNVLSAESHIHYLSFIVAGRKVSLGEKSDPSMPQCHGYPVRLSSITRKGSSAGSARKSSSSININRNVFLCGNHQL